MTVPIREDERGVSFDVLVQPRASKARIGPVHGDRIKVAVTSPPVDGEANAAVIELVAKALGVRRADVEITAGASSRRKTLRVAGIRAALLLSLIGCGHSGTIDVAIVTAPGSHVLDPVQHAKLTLSTPLTIVEADRGADGSFALSLDVTADGPSGDVTFEGFDSAGAVVAYGRTPPLPIAAIDASIAIYVGAPDSLDEAPVTLGTARTDMGAGLLDYGVLLAGGRDAAGAPTSDLVIYNAYDHSLQVGLDLPEPRAGIAVGTGVSGFAYLFGGTDATGAPRGNLWRFDTTVAPDGAFVAADELTDLARSDVSIAPLGSDAFLLTGDPPILLEGLFMRATAFNSPATLGGQVASIADPNGNVFTLAIGEGAGSTGIMRLTPSEFAEQTNAPPDALRTGHAVVATAEGSILAVAGADASGPLRSVIKCDPTVKSYVEVPDVLATGRTDAAVAVTASYLVVAGGRDVDGNLVPDAEIFTADTLEPVATIPMLVPRAGATARPLPNQQILIAGGVDDTGAPVDTLELFTPPDPL